MALHRKCKQYDTGRNQREIDTDGKQDQETIPPSIPLLFDIDDFARRGKASALAKNDILIMSGYFLLVLSSTPNQKYQKRSIVDDAGCALHAGNSQSWIILALPKSNVGVGITGSAGIVYGVSDAFASLQFRQIIAKN